MEKKKLRKNMEVKVISKMNVLKKLQLTVSLIFVFMTLGILLIFVNQWVVGASLALLGYIMTVHPNDKIVIGKEAIILLSQPITIQTTDFLVSHRNNLKQHF